MPFPSDPRTKINLSFLDILLNASSIFNLALCSNPIIHQSFDLKLLIAFDILFVLKENI